MSKAREYAEIEVKFSEIGQMHLEPLIHLLAEMLAKERLRELEQTEDGEKT